MQNTIQHPFARTFDKSPSKVSVWKKFIAETDGHEENRFRWTALVIAGHGCVFTIITSIMVLFTGNHFIFWPFVIGAIAASVVVNLAAMPTKITIPVFFFSLPMDLVIITICLTNGFNIEATNI